MNDPIPFKVTALPAQDTERHPRPWLVLNTPEGLVGGRLFEGSYVEAIEKADLLNADRFALEHFFRNRVPTSRLPELVALQRELFLLAPESGGRLPQD